MLVPMISKPGPEEHAAFWADLHARYYPIMRKKSYEIARDDVVAEDMIQEAYVRLLGKVHLLRTLEPPRLAAYLASTVRNVTLNYVKKRNRQWARTRPANEWNGCEGVEGIADGRPSLEEMCHRREEYDRLGRMIGSLSERDRRLLYLKYIAELTDRELAASLGVKPANIRAYLSRARRRASNLLKEGFTHI